MNYARDALIEYISLAGHISIVLSPRHLSVGRSCLRLLFPHPFFFFFFCHKYKKDEKEIPQLPRWLVHTSMLRHSFADNNNNNN